MARTQKHQKASNNSHLYNSGTFYNIDRVDCSDLRVTPFVPLNCNKREFAHLKHTPGRTFLSLAASESLVEEKDDD